MLRKQFGILLLALAPLHGCVFYKGFEKLPEPLERPTYHEEYRSTLEVEAGVEKVASIGDSLFTVRRLLLHDNEVPIVSSPIPRQPFPLNATWTGTHYRDGKNGERWIVYTTPDYYRGNIGVLLDDQDRLATKKSVVQVAGGKAGKGWSAPRGAKFFERSTTLVDVWRLRYGGKKGTAYEFEVIDVRDEKEIEVLQEIEITPEEFKRGFIIKGVLIKGLNESEYGVITFSVEDVTVNQTKDKP